MTIGFNRLRRTAAPRAIAICAMNLLAAGNASAADDASPWDGDVRSAVRVIAGSSATPERAPIRAGIELRLKNGWHTYWRYPGDAGVPPRFDFAGSQNVKSIEVLWPAPLRIPEQGLVMLYSRRGVGKTHVALGIAAAVASGTSFLQWRAPSPQLFVIAAAVIGGASLLGGLTLSGGLSSHDAALTAAEARLPHKAAVGEGSTLAIKSVRREAAGSRARVLVDVAAPPAAAVALFAEGPTPEWALPVPVAVDGAPKGLQRFAFDLDGAPPGATYDGAAIALTAVAGDAAIEVVTRLD